MQKGVEAELERLLEQEADHLDCLQTEGTGYPISTAHLPTSAAMPLKSITKSLKKSLTRISSQAITSSFQKKNNQEKIF